MPYRVKRGDSYRIKFTAEADGAPFDLTGATNLLLLAKPYGETVDEGVSLPIVDQNDTLGEVFTDDWSGLATPGDWDVELQVTIDGEVITFPSPDEDGYPVYERITVIADIPTPAPT